MSAGNGHGLGWDDDEPNPECVFYGYSGYGLTRLVDVLPWLSWPGAESLFCIESAASVMLDYVAECEHHFCEDGSDCLHDLALYLHDMSEPGWRPAAMRQDAIPELIQRIGRDSEQNAQFRTRAEILKTALPVLKIKLGLVSGVSAFRALCGCDTCETLRQPDGWRKLAGVLPQAADQSWHDELPASARPPVPLADVTMPLVRFVATLNPDQRVLTTDGRVMPASEFAREIEVPLLDGDGKPVLDAQGKPVTRRQIVGRALDGNAEETAYPGVGPLAAAAMPRGPRMGHDWQACRVSAALRGETLPTGRRCPHGFGPDNMQVEPERCCWCGAVAGADPGQTGTARPLVVLCEHCLRDVISVSQQPEGWRYIVQPGHGLESMIGRTRLADVRLPGGRPVFDLATVEPGWLPFVLSLLPPDLAVVDKFGELSSVASWIALIHEMRTR